MGAVTVGSPLTSEDRAMLFPDGSVAVAYVSPYRVDWRSPDGLWHRGLPLPHRPVRVNDEEICAIARRMLEERSAAVGPCQLEALRNYPWPEYIPPFLVLANAGMSASASPTLFAAPDGKLVIRRTPTVSEADSRYDIVDRNGRLFRTLLLPANEAIIGFGNESVYVVTIDEFGLQRLRRHAW
jgi:hypothetical protein